MRIAIFGTGGIGGYYGGRLAQAGEEVTFIARGAHLQALHRRGLQVDGVKGDFVLHPVKATDDPATVGVVDTVILGVKTWQIDRGGAGAASAARSGHRRGDDSERGRSACHNWPLSWANSRCWRASPKFSATSWDRGIFTIWAVRRRLLSPNWTITPSERVLRLRQACERAGIGVETPAGISTWRCGKSCCW